MKASMQHSVKLNSNDTPKNLTETDNKFISKSSIENFYPKKEGIIKKVSNERQMVEDICQFSLKDIKSRAKPLLLDYLKKILKIISFSHSIFQELEQLDNASSLNSIFESTFKILTSSMNSVLDGRLLINNENVQAKDIVIRSREAKRLRLIKQEQGQGEVKMKGRSVKKLQQFQRTNENLKRQVFNLKEENKRLQSKVVNLIDEYQKRKGFYVAQIKKLTEIIRMSSVDVRNLVLQKTKEARVMQKTEVSKEGDNSQININVVNSKNNYDDGRFLKLNTKVSQFNQDNYGVYNGYNTQFRLLKNVSSIQNME